MNVFKIKSIFLFSFLCLVNPVIMDPCEEFLTFKDVCKRHPQNKIEDYRYSLFDTFVTGENYYGLPGYRILDSPPMDNGYCSTRFPIWIKNVPVRGIKGKAVNGTMCMMYDAVDNCHNPSPVDVHFCGGFKIYKLAKASEPNSAFCLVPEAGSCLKNSSCRLGSGLQSCKCKEDQSGISCEDAVNPCLSTPCQNEGECTYGLENYRCKCKDGYSGRNCEIYICDIYQYLPHICRRLSENQITNDDPSLSDDNIDEISYFGNPGFKLLGRQPSINTCGTKSPIWFSKLPQSDTEGQSFELVGCVVTRGNDCAKMIKIKVYYCKEVHLYKLKRTPKNASYCFVRDETAPVIHTCRCNKVGDLQHCDDVNPCNSYLPLPNPCQRLWINKRKSSEDSLSDNDISIKTYFGHHGFKLRTGYPPTADQCGSLRPIWIKELPDEEEGVGVNVTACVVTPGRTCDVKLLLTVHFCKDLLVYRLSKTQQNSAYCLDFDMKRCPECGRSRDSKKCRCLQQEHGIQCEDTTDYCASNPCKNDGVCLNAFSTYVCRCSKRYFGKHCENSGPSTLILMLILILSLFFLIMAGYFIIILSRKYEQQSDQQMLNTYMTEKESESSQDSDSKNDISLDEIQSDLGFGEAEIDSIYESDYTLHNITSKRTDI